MKIMQYTPIIVLAVLALGIMAVKVYRPHGAVRINAIDVVAPSAVASARSLPDRDGFCCQRKGWFENANDHTRGGDVLPECGRFTRWGIGAAGC